MGSKSDNYRAKALKQIARNIKQYGHHTYVVLGEKNPRFAYTIGLKPKCGAELIFAGASIFSIDEAHHVVEEVAARVAESPRPRWVKIDGFGSFMLRKVHRSWIDHLMLGALDYWHTSEIAAFQIVPDKAHLTVDVPNMSNAVDPNSEPIWQWLLHPWKHSIPSTAVAATNLSALRGEPITEAVRWEKDYWELFAGPGPDVTEKDRRMVPMGTLLGADESLVAVTKLKVGRGIWRSGPDGEWNSWERKF